MNEEIKLIQDYTHEEVLELKEKVTKEDIVAHIVVSWAELYHEKIINQKHSDNLYETNRKRAINKVYNMVNLYDPQAHFFILDHSKLLTPAHYKMVGIKFLEMDFRDLLQIIKTNLLDHLDALKKGHDKVLNPKELEALLSKFS